jgi:intracellular septation protein A
MAESNTNQANLSDTTQYVTAEDIKIPPQATKKPGFLDSHFSKEKVQRIKLFGFFFQHVILEIALPLILFFTLKQPVGDLWATIYSSIPGLLSTLFTILVKRRFEPIPIIIIISFFIGFALTLKYNNPKLKQVDGSIITGIIGLAFLFSLLLNKPLIYYTSRPWITKNDPDKLEEFEEKWKNRAFRKTMTNMSLIWGFGLILQAVINLILIFTISLDLLMILSPVITYGNLGLLTVVTVVYGMRKKKQAEALAKLNQERNGNINENIRFLENSDNIV